MANKTFSGKVAVVTGAASGLGYALSKALIESDAYVIMIDIDQEKLVAAPFGEKMVADVRHLDDLEKCFHDIVKRKGKIDYLFNNAGIVILGKFDRYTSSDWDDILDVNVKGVINGIRAIYPIFIKQKNGHIINTASFSGLVPSPQMFGYSATKYAIVGLSEALRLELQSNHIQISLLCPSYLQTPLLYGGKYGKNRTGIPTPILRSAMAKFSFPDPDAFAHLALRQILKNKFVILSRWTDLCVWILYRISPYFAIKLSQRLTQGVRTSMIS